MGFDKYIISTEPYMKITQITETTTSGSISPVATVLGATHTRGNPSIYGGKKVKSMFSGKKTKEPYGNSLHEDVEISEQDLIMMPGLGNKINPGFISKQDDRTDNEIAMAINDLFQSGRNAEKIYKMIEGRSEEVGLEGWVQEKIIKASDYLNTVREYLEGQEMSNVDEGGRPFRGVDGAFDKGDDERHDLDRPKKWHVVIDGIIQSQGFSDKEDANIAGHKTLAANPNSRVTLKQKWADDYE